MDDANVPPTQPAGALIPPTKYPGTAIAVATPEPPNRRVPRQTMRARQARFAELVAFTLDFVDDLADAVATSLRLR
ncbi:MAG TPA: hypothetical protein VH277_01100 [Gemmatimonadaceae bacterium]|jgi:hypothetical protein|nr:hypothetical protein [Gemmatimonadaceae bacterium]